MPKIPSISSRVNDAIFWIPETNTATNKLLFFNQKVLIFSYFFMKTCCGYSLETPLWGASKGFPLHILWRNKKNSMWIPYLIWSYEPMMNWTHLCLASNKRDTGKQCKLRSDAAECHIWSGFILFVFNSGISIKDNTKNQQDTPYIRLEFRDSDVSPA